MKIYNKKGLAIGLLWTAAGLRAVRKLDQRKAELWDKLWKLDRTGGA